MMQLLSMGMLSKRRKLQLEEEFHQSKPRSSKMTEEIQLQEEQQIQEVQKPVSLLDAIRDSNTTTLTIIPRLIINVSVTDNADQTSIQISELSKVLDLNIVNPFRNKNEKKGKKEGFLRGTVVEMIKYFDVIHSRPVTIMGSDQTILQALEKMVVSVLTRVRGLLPASDLEKELASVFTIDAWPTLVSDGSGDSLAYINLVLTVNSPAIYTSDDKCKLIKQVLTLLTTLSGKQETQFPYTLAVTLSTDQLRYGPSRDLLDMLTVEETENPEEMSFIMVTRNAMRKQLLEGNASDILPNVSEEQGPDDVLNRLFVYGGDMLFIKA